MLSGRPTDALAASDVWATDRVRRPLKLTGQLRGFWKADGRSAAKTPASDAFVRRDGQRPTPLPGASDAQKTALSTSNYVAMKTEVVLGYLTVTIGLLRARIVKCAPHLSHEAFLSQATSLSPS